MDQETREMFQMIVSGMESMELRLREEIKSSERRTMVYIENNVTKRIDTLFDGYKLTHEKQWELERKVESLEARLERLESLQSVV